jgi:hypothetical protein
MRLALAAPAAALLFIAGGAAAQPATTPAATTPAAPSTAAVQRDPAAIAALEQMGAYLRTLTTFQIDADITNEEVLDTGQSIQYTAAVDLVAQRPNRLRVNLDSTRKRRQYFYDGSTLTIWAPRQAFYAQIVAPPTIQQLIAQASDRLDLAIPFADMFELGQNAELTNRITSAMVIGSEAVDDQVCTHYAFRQARVDWEIWIREGEQPLPCRYRIVSLEDDARPAYEVSLTWNMTPTIGPNTFTFVPPEGADRIPIAVKTASAQ